VRGNTLVDGICVRTIGKANVYVGVLQPEPGVYIRRDFVIGSQDVLDVHIDKVIERVNVLFDQTLDL
jgi:hypothetical protein